MSPVEHVKPVDHDDLARVLFELEDRTFGEAEVLWAEPLTAETARLDNIPLLIFGVSKGDIVKISRNPETPRFLGVAERGGHSTYRVMLEDPDDPSTQAQFREMVVLGCGHEQLTPRFIAVDVPSDIDIFKVYDLLEQGLNAGVWTFEEGHCGHPMDTR